jgi:hypothetical protein
MTAQQARVAYRRPPTVSPPLEVPTADRSADLDEPAWLWESLRHEFWDASELARSIAPGGPFTQDQRAAIAHWWSILAALEALGPPMYAAMFARATEQHDADQTRWSLLGMLRDGLKHEQVCRIALERLAPGSPGEEASTNLARDADRHLRQVEREAGRCWHAWRRALNRDGTGVVSGAMLLRSLTLGGFYEQWAYACAIPAVATVLRNIARDAGRHRCVLRAIADRGCRYLSAAQRAEAATQVQGTARLLSVALLDPLVVHPVVPDDHHTCEPGFGIPVAEQRLEVVRTALLEVRQLHGRHGIAFEAVPELAIPASPVEPSDSFQRTEGPPGA